VKALVAECVKRNRMGDPHFSPLHQSLELRLRGLVGPVYWKQAKDTIHSFHRLHPSAAPARQAGAATSSSPSDAAV